MPEAVQPESQTEPEETQPLEDVTQEPVETEQPVGSAEGKEKIEIVVTVEQETGYRVPDGHYRN